MTSTAHVMNPEVLKIPGYSHGVGIFVQCSKKWRDIAYSTPAEEVEWVTTEVERVNITNVYKPPGTRLCLDSLPRYQQPCIYAGDFNCHSNTWGYSSTNTDGTTLEHGASNADVTLLYDPKQPRSFLSARWGHIDKSGSVFCQSWNMCESARIFRKVNGRSSQTDSTRQPTGS